MNKSVKLVLVFVSCLTLAQNTFSQIQFFDSVKTVVSSQQYDYKNPAFNNKSGYFNYFYWLAYERHNGNTSDIIVRKAFYSSYDNEIVITITSNAQNINPSMDQGMLVWQSNARGNWDIYYSVQTGDTWSAPALVDSSLSDETDPFIKNNNLAPGDFNFSYLAYKRDNTIRFKRYKSSTGIWDNDTLVSEGNDEHITPVITKGDFGNQFGLLFLRKYPGGLTRINQRIFYENYSGPPVAWENVFEIYQPNPQNNLSFSYANSDYLTYSYDTLNSTHILIFPLAAQDYKGVVTKNVPGNHILGKGSYMAIITDGIYFQFSAFSVLSRNSDSLFFTFINRPGSFNNNPQYKKLYLGDSSLAVKFDVSQPIFNQSYFYRIKTVWENISGSKTELVESYMTDYLSEIENHNSAAEEYSLSQNYPNPFNPTTHLEFGISNLEFVSLKVYNNLGKEVAVLVSENKPAGVYSVEFDGSGLSSGIYFYRLEAGDFSETKRMILLK